MKQRNKPKMATTVEWITPIVAALYLARNERNRRTNRRKIAGIVRCILAGRWKTTHQGIAFDTNGHLRDGQNRLQAIIDADTSVWMNVTRDVGMSDCEEIDNQQKRSVDDVYLMRTGKRLPPGTSSASNRMMLGDTQQGGGPSSRDISLDYIESHRDLLQKAYEVLPHKKKRITSAAVMAVIARACDSVPEQTLREWCCYLVTGDPLDWRRRKNLGATKKLREWLLAENRAGSEANRSEVYRKAQFVLSEYIRGRSPRSLTAIPGNLFKLRSDE
jgi:hypothetical protein